MATILLGASLQDCRSFLGIYRRRHTLRLAQVNQPIFGNAAVPAAKCANVRSQIPKFQLSGDR